MDIILYNPLSNKGKNVKIAEKLEKQSNKKGIKSQILNLLDIHNVESFLSAYSSDDRIIIIGGDGTLNRIVNQINDTEILPQVFMYKAGTGNDFIRSVKTKGKFVDIKPYIKNLPTIEVNGKTEKFLNGAGVGFDGFVCYNVNVSKSAKNKSNYFKNVFKSFINYKPVSALIDVDGKVFEENKVWFVTAMNAQFFGGGMRLAPKMRRDKDYLELVIVKKIPKWLLIILFPSIYLGLHRFLYKYVQFYQGKRIKVELLTDSYLQRDGEHEYPVRKFEVNK
ncbi:diacylglycerol/lipid kinase family protein [Acholeplasma granularum]|uniref:diacylglycerol/lipid kinase family protein n=1 Tax=Acholeplasma granularum TaxID=264635 RepID=UPI00047093A6|nr:diacylglycerol kinase family protein [Acholeplasma granularum]